MAMLLEIMLRKGLWGLPVWQWALAAVFASLSLWIASTLLARRFFLTSLKYDEEHSVKTEDASSVDLYCLRGNPSEANGSKRPVLLVHGIGMDHRNVDVSERVSLARFLQNRGRDVWLVRMRSGRGPITKTEKRDLESLVAFDLPAAVNFVSERSSDGMLDYVSFSMGGTILYGAMDTSFDASKIATAAFVGSPARIILSPALAFLARVVARIPRFLRFPIPVFALSQSLAWSIEWIKTPFHRLVVNPTNVERGSLRSAWVLMKDVPPSLLFDFVNFANQDRVVKTFGVDVVQRVRKAKIPALFVSGGDDRIAPQASIQIAFDAWGSETGVSKEWVRASVAEGFAADYGHADLMMGRVAKEEIFERIEAFLRLEQDQAGTTSTTTVEKKNEKD